MKRRSVSARRERKVSSTLALTLTLSPGQRGQLGALVEDLFVAVAGIAGSDFTVEIVRHSGAFASPERGECFSLSWGRGLG